MESGRFTVSTPALLANAVAMVDKGPRCASRTGVDLEVQTDEFWEDITKSILEHVRKRLRSPVKFIEKTKRQNIYTDYSWQPAAARFGRHC